MDLEIAMGAALGPEPPVKRQSSQRNALDPVADHRGHIFD